ncbi:permease-like cell division protein FtsX [soil metagenome]
MITSRRSVITLGRIIHTGIVNFIRNASLAIAAMAVMVVTLTIILFSLVTNATFTNTIAQITNQVNISVFLQNNVSDSSAAAFAKAIEKQPNVKKVEYLDKAQALQSFIEQNKGKEGILEAAAVATNPVPATIHVFPADLNQIDSIQKFLTTSENQALQTKDSPSYQGDRKEAIDKITHATNVLQQIGVIAVITFAVISALIIFNTIQMAIFNRRDEIQIMRLLGASTWYIRGPFVVESIIYGILSAVISVLIINSAFVAASTALQASSLGLLDIQYANDYFAARFLWFLTLQIAIGILLGAASSTIATRRYLKFKTSKK